MLLLDKYRIAASPMAALDRLGFAPLPERPVSYVVEGANWATKWDGILVSRRIEQIAPGTSRLLERPHNTAHSLLHFFSHYQWLSWGPWLARSNRCVVTFYHGKPSDDEISARQIEAFLKSVPRIDKVVTSARLVEERLIEWGVPKAKVLRIPIPIDLTVFKPPSIEERAAARRRVGVPDGRIAIGSFQKDGVGWGDGSEPKLIKGPDILVETARRVARERPVFVVLTGPARGYVKSGLAAAGIPFSHALLEDYLDVPSYYAALDVYLNPSREEGGPKGILEAMAMDVPVVSTTVGMAPDVICHGESGFLAESEDSEGLAHGILSLVEGDVDLVGLRSAARAAVAVCSGEAVGDLHWRHIVEPHLRERSRR